MKEYDGVQPEPSRTTCCRGFAAKKKTGSSKETNPDHCSEIAKLNRVIGQLAGVKRMVEQRRYCPEILVQTRAAAAALKKIELTILRTHIEHCLSKALVLQDQANSGEKIEELLSLLGRF